MRYVRFSQLTAADHVLYIRDRVANITEIGGRLEGITGKDLTLSFSFSNGATFSCPFNQIQHMIAAVE